MKIVIMSGISGSGKSTHAQKLLAQKAVDSFVDEDCVCSADAYFMLDGKYQFDVTKLGSAHATCMRNFVDQITMAVDRDLHDAIVIVDNTNTTVEEITPYYLVAKAFDCQVELVTTTCDVNIAAMRNKHNVPAISIQQQADRIAARQIPSFWDIKQTVVSS